MPAGYLIAHITVTNPDAYQEYVTRVPDIMEAYGGRYLVRGGSEVTTEGQVAGPRHVIMEFPSLEAAKTFYHSAAYQDIVPLRTDNATSTISLVEGV